MKKLESMREVLEALKAGEILTTNASDLFQYKKGMIRVRNAGTRYSLSLEDFLDLYQHNTFFLYSDDNAIDEEKDEAYYRYYRK
ncbi:MAG: hypothetical protein IIZ47_02255 [Erysipelotrichaceae bacterium]|nr:hypothetical protein [Erysipelotrichaceae bacterium]